MAKSYLEPNEVEQLEKAALYLRDKILIRLLFHLGCRISEALALEVNNIDSDRGTVTIEHLKSRIKFACPKCVARLGKSLFFYLLYAARVTQQLPLLFSRGQSAISRDAGWMSRFTFFVKLGDIMQICHIFPKNLQKEDSDSNIPMIH
jgi:integrase